MAVKGRTNNPNGKPKGAKNKVSEEIRVEFKMFLHYASPKIIELWEKLLEDNPKEALSVIKDYAEFVLPKLARVEHKTSDDQHEEYMKILEKMHDSETAGSESTNTQETSE